MQGHVKQGVLPGALPASPLRELWWEILQDSLPGSPVETSNSVKSNPEIRGRENARMINKRCEPKAAPSRSQSPPRSH